ncbi:MAG TPA: peptidoglycan bridge formation protein FemAB, partial [Accumulibacter sp.]|nr:peptidoglycan bridge formation protein FemAB [Accumulibacter sp.]
MEHNDLSITRGSAGSPRLNVRLLDSNDRHAVEAWDAFVNSSPDATFFHKSGWQRVIREVFSHSTSFLYAERAGIIEGVLPLAQVKSRLFGNSLVSLPFAVYGGVAASTNEAVTAL